MAFRKIDYAGWERREIYEYFSTTCMYTTVQMDVGGFLSAVKAQDIRFYPAFLHAVAAVVNGCEDYRYGLDENRTVGLWDTLHPLYTVPRRDKPHLFSMVSTSFTADFRDFYRQYLLDSARAAGCGRMMCDPLADRGHIGITAMPGVHFSAFAFGDAGGKPDLTPFVVVGKYEQGADGRVLLPVTGEFAHAVNDGHHIQQFFSHLERRLGDAHAWLS